MAELKMTDQIYAYVTIVAGIFVLVLGLNTQGELKFLFMAVAALMIALSGAIYKYGYILIPLLTRFARIVEVHDAGYELPPGQEAIIKKIGDMYYASMYLLVRIYESASEKTPEENVAYTEYFERAISSVKYVTKFSMMVYVKDMKQYRERIETKRAEGQLRLSRERDKPEPDVLKVDRYEREVTMYDSMLGRIASGVKPMGVISYVMTTATGVTKESALAAARNQANELKATIGNALNTEVVLLTGEEMRRCYDWELFLPPTQAEMETSLR
ncbi:MAG: hypothetical protein WC759_03755 [Candidatus Micrarchaeia archaeon]|jgi:hypothetical protein